MIDTSLIVKAREFAQKYHKGQKRKNSNKDYFEAHLEKVAHYIDEHSSELFPSSSWNNWLYKPEIFEQVIAAAYLHDVLEDTKATVETLKEAKFPFLVIDMVVVLTRRQESYFDFIMRINDCGAITVGCRAIKLADLRCNMKDLDEGSLKDKYRLAEYILMPRN